MSKQWGHGYHQGFGKGSLFGAFFLAILALIVWVICSLCGRDRR